MMTEKTSLYDGPPLCVAVHAPGRYIISLKRLSANPPFVTLRVTERNSGVVRLVVIPALCKARYLLECTVPLLIEADLPQASTFDIRKAWIGDLWAIRSMRRWRSTTLVPLGQAGTILPLLDRRDREAKELLKTLRIIVKTFGMPEWSRELAGTLLPVCRSFAPEVASTRKSEVSPAFAVVLHLHYRDLWPEFEFFLTRIAQPFHLIITITGQDEAFERRVRSVFPDAEIILYANRGRDVGPFQQLQHEGRLDRFALICKLHGKKSGTEGIKALYGDVWRRICILNLLGDTNHVARILDLFATDPDTGMVGPACLRMPHAGTPPNVAWGTSRGVTLFLAERLGFTPDSFPLDFFAGTMFWLRRSILEPLKPLELTINSFPQENGSVDGDIHHGMERLYGALPALSGMKLVSIRHEVAETGSGAGASGVPGSVGQTG